MCKTGCGAIYDDVADEISRSDHFMYYKYPAKYLITSSTEDTALVLAQRSPCLQIAATSSTLALVFASCSPCCTYIRLNNTSIEQLIGDLHFYFLHGLKKQLSFAICFLPVCRYP
jgi:hypothetical protein